MLPGMPTQVLAALHPTDFSDAVPYVPPRPIRPYSERSDGPSAARSILDREALSGKVILKLPVVEVVV